MNPNPKSITTPPAYYILEDGTAIHCRFCGLTSWNLHDVQNRYCGHCKVFHEHAPKPRYESESAGGCESES